MLIVFTVDITEQIQTDSPDGGQQDAGLMTAVVEKPG